jgi:hypothetical protein
LPTTDNYAVKPIKGPYTDTYNPNATQETPVTVIDGATQKTPTPSTSTQNQNLTQQASAPTASTSSTSGGEGVAGALAIPSPSSEDDDVDKTTATGADANNGYVSNYPSYKGFFSIGDALAAKGVSIGLDVVGAIPGLGNAVSTSAAGARVVGGVATWGGAAAGLATMNSSDPIGQESALVGAGLAWYNVALGGAKAVPIAGNILSVVTGLWDTFGAYKAYQSCMASPKYD